MNIIENPLCFLREFLSLKYFNILKQAWYLKINSCCNFPGCFQIHMCLTNTYRILRYYWKSRISMLLLIHIIGNCIIRKRDIFTCITLSHKSFLLVTRIPSKRRNIFNFAYFFRKVKMILHAHFFLVSEKVTPWCITWIKKVQLQFFFSRNLLKKC